MIEVREAKTCKEKKEFLNFPLNLYKSNPYFVAPLYMDEKKIFNKNYYYNDQCDTIYLNAYKDNKIVGRISGIIQKVANKKWNQKRVRFTRFDSIDDQEVANALFDYVSSWAKDKGMEEIVGPLGFSDLEREGLLTYGYDQMSTFEEQYNYPYYVSLVESYGFTKEIGWFERKLYKPKDFDERYEKFERISSKMLDKFGLRYAKFKSIKEFLNKYGDKFFDIIDETYDKIYGTVPINEKMRKNLIDSFKLICDTRFLMVILDKDDNAVCFGIAMPSISRAFKKSNGHLTLGSIFRFLKDKKHPKVLDLALIGVVDKYAKWGVASSLIKEIMGMFDKYGIEYFETNLNLEDNEQINAQWKNFDNIIHKKRSSYIKKL